MSKLSYIYLPGHMADTIADIITKIENNKDRLGITLYPKATTSDISAFENNKSLRLPGDLREFYSFSNGFESSEDMFRIIPLNEIIENG
jgi:hypothetical protein